MIDSAPATLFGGALAGAGVTCHVRFEGELLAVASVQSHRVHTNDISVQIGGADDDALLLIWEEEGVAYSVIVEDQTAKLQLVNSAPHNLVPKLTKWRGKARFQHLKWNAVLTSIGLLALAVVLVIWQSQRIERWLAAKIPLQTEVRLGESAFKQISLSSHTTQDGPAAEAIKSIGNRLTKGSRYKYRWYIKSDDSLNAFALPGGIVVVHTGLLEKTNSAEELAGVLAHEVQHLEQRHSLQQMIHSAGWAAILAGTLGDVSAITTVLIHQAGNLRNSRELESQADMEGVKILVKTGISPSGMVTFFQRMADEMPENVPLLSTHPASKDRLENIKQQVKQHVCICSPLPYDWTTVRSSLPNLTKR